MDRRVSSLDAAQLTRTRSFQLGVSLLVGVIVFLLAEWLLQVLVNHRPDESIPPTTTVTESLAPRIAPGKVAISAPVSGAQSLLTEVQPGDRMDIIALFPASLGQSAASAVIVRGATVLNRPVIASGAPILFEVTPDESLVMAHMIQSGAQLSYSLWPANGPPPALPVLDVATVRARLGLAQPIIPAVVSTPAFITPPAEQPAEPS